MKPPGSWLRPGSAWCRTAARWWSTGISAEGTLRGRPPVEVAIASSRFSFVQSTGQKKPLKGLDSGARDIAVHGAGCYMGVVPWSRSKLRMFVMTRVLSRAGVALLAVASLVACRGPGAESPDDAPQ